MGELFGAGPSLPYKERLAIIGEAGIALWDSLQACVRPGSLDSSITDEVPNEFPAFFAKYPTITHVFFNGEKPETAFRRHALPTLNGDRHMLKRLPSTSSAYAAMSLDDKVRAWSVVKKALS
jgi:hypoxanthine-DNA glycosylase